MKPIDVHVEVLTTVQRAHSRRVIEAILACIRASQRGHRVPSALARKVQHLPYEIYRWHVLAWRMQGFRRTSKLGTTPEGHVYVEREGKVWLGYPETDDVVQLTNDPEAPPALPDLASMPAVAGVH